MTDEPQPAETPETSNSGTPSKDECTWGLIAHLSSLAGYFIPFGNVIGPLVVWIVKKDESAFIADQSKEAMNFQITVMLAIMVCIPLMFVCIGIPMAIAVGIADLVFTIIAAIKANDGVMYRYPMTLRLIK